MVLLSVILDYESILKALCKEAEVLEPGVSEASEVPLASLGSGRGTAHPVRSRIQADLRAIHLDSLAFRLCVAPVEGS